MTERQIADALSAALHQLGIVTYAAVHDYKEAPGGPVVELMLTPADAAKLAQALNKGTG